MVTVIIIFLAIVHCSYHYYSFDTTRCTFSLYILM